MKNTTKIYFASDVHLGVPDDASSRERELKLIRWLDQVSKDATEIFIVGDLFDFWFEYRHAIPRGFARIQGKIASITDSGIPVHLFTGNHDMWMFDYLPKELGVSVHREPIEREWEGKKFFIGHGDGLGPGDYGYKFIKKVFANRLCQWLFARLHPNFGIGLANYFSRKSRIATSADEEIWQGEEKEWLVHFCKDELSKSHHDYFVFGHRHLPIEFDLGQDSTYYNLGDWIRYNSYLEFDGDRCYLRYFEK